MLPENHAMFRVISRPPAETKRVSSWSPTPRVRLLLSVLALLALAAPLVRADEPLFGFTYTTDLLPKHKVELEQWSTTRFTKASGKFVLQENRTEVSYGVTDRFSALAV